MWWGRPVSPVKPLPWIALKVKLTRLPVSALLVLITVGCVQQPGVPTAKARQSAIPSTAPASPGVAASAFSGGCGATPVVRGREPEWLEDAGAHNNPKGLPYVVATEQTAAGFIFGYPLRAGHPENPANKILWVVRLPGNGSNLEIKGHPLGTSKPAVEQSQPANSGPGEIYPSIVDAPQPGCWHFDLSWAGHKATVELEYA